MLDNRGEGPGLELEHDLNSKHRVPQAPERDLDGAIGGRERMRDRQNEEGHRGPDGQGDEEDQEEVHPS